MYSFSLDKVTQEQVEEEGPANRFHVTTSEIPLRLFDCRQDDDDARGGLESRLKNIHNHTPRFAKQITLNVNRDLWRYV